MRELLTPICFVVFGIAVLAVFATWRRDRLVARLAWLLFIASYLFSTAIPVGIMVRAWEVKAPRACQVPRENTVYVVLTGGASGRARADTDIGLLHQATVRRLVAAIDLASQTTASSILISGGKEVGTVTEAQMARQFVRRLGWPADRMDIENVSHDTKTSAVEVARLMRDRADPANAVIVTSALHMRRALLAYRQEGVDFLGCPTDFADLFPILPDALLPDAGVLQKSGGLWKEVAGFIMYSLQYGTPKAQTMTGVERRTAMSVRIACSSVEIFPARR